MSLIVEIAAGVAAGVVIGFLVLANWSSIVHIVEKLLGFAFLIGVLAGIAWVIQSLSTPMDPTSHQVINYAGGALMLVLLGTECLACYLLLAAVFRWPETLTVERQMSLGIFAGFINLFASGLLAGPVGLLARMDAWSHTNNLKDLGVMLALAIGAQWPWPLVAWLSYRKWRASREQHSTTPETAAHAERQ